MASGLPPLHMGHTTQLLCQTGEVKLFKADMIHISRTGLFNTTVITDSHKPIHPQ